MRKNVRKLSVFSLPKDMSFEDAIPFLKAIGVDAIEPYPQGELKTPDIDAAKRIREQADRQGVVISCFSTAADLVSDKWMSEMQRLRAYIDVAAELGSPYFHHTIAPDLDIAKHADDFMPVLDAALPRVRQLIEYAAQKGVKCIYEDQGAMFNGKANFSRFINALDGCDIGTLLDTGNSVFVDEAPHEMFLNMTDRIMHVHIKDYVISDAPISGDRRNYLSFKGRHIADTEIGKGSIDLAAVFRLLDGAGYDGYVSLEYAGYLGAKGIEQCMNAIKNDY